MKAHMIILGIASLWAIYWTFRNKHILSGLISIGMIVGIILAYLKLNGSIIPGVIVFLLSAFIALFYTLFLKKFSFAKRVVITLITLPTIFYWVFMIYHLPGTNWLWYGLFLPFVGLIYGLVRPVNLKNEWGFVIILLAETFTHIYPILLH